MITILDRTKKPKIFKYEDHAKPNFRTTYERDKWFAQEKKYWKEGKDHLPGTLYYYLTQQLLKNRVTGEIHRPWAREADLILHEHLKHDRGLRPTGVFKPRGFGFSVQAGALASYTGINYPGSNTLITSKETATIKDFFTQKMAEPFSHMDPDIVGEPKNASQKVYKGTQPVYIDRMNATRSECSLRLAVRHRNKDDKIITAYSQIITKETASSDKATNGFSGMGGLTGIVDELPLHRRREMLMTSMMECFVDPMTKKLIGTVLWGGTVEDSLTDQELMEFQKTSETFVKQGHNIIFFPYDSIMFLDENGYPDRVRAKEWHDNELKIRDGDEIATKAFLKLHPRSQDDLFEMASSDALEGDVLNALKAQRKIVIQDNEPLMPVEIVNNSGKAEFAVVKESPVKILEPPKPNCEYVTLVDSMALGTEAGPAQGSDYCAVTVKMYDPSGFSYMPVAYYKERPKTVEGAYWQTIRLSELYEQMGGSFAGIMAEASNSTEEWFTNMLILNGFQRYIMYRKDLSGKGYVNTNKSFQPVNNWNMDYQYKHANIFLRKWVNSIRLLPLIDELLMPLEKNADMRSAWLMLFMAFPDINKAESSVAERKARRVSVVQADAKGNRNRKVIVKNSTGSKRRAGEILSLQNER